MREQVTLVTGSLTRSPKIRRLGKLLQRDFDSALGVAVRWLAFCQEQFSNAATGMTAAEVDEEMRCQGLTRALRLIGWVNVAKDGTIFIVDFGKYSWERFLNARRQQRYRDRQDAAPSADSSLQRAGDDGQPDGASPACLTNAATHALPTPPQKSNAPVTQNVTHGVTPSRACTERAHADNPNEFISTNDIEKNDLAVGTRAQETPDEPDQVDRRFLQFCMQLAPAHPALRNMRRYPADVAQAFQLAYQTLPSAAEHAELLAAYYAADFDRYPRNNWWRPNGAAMFLKSIADVLASAQAWAKADRWKPLAARRKKQAQQPEQDKGEPATPEEVEALFASVRPPAPTTKEKQ